MLKRKSFVLQNFACLTLKSCSAYKVLQRQIFTFISVFISKFEFVSLTTGSAPTKRSCSREALPTKPNNNNDDKNDNDNNNSIERGC